MKVWRQVRKNKIVIASCVSCKLHFFKLVVQSPDGKMREYRQTPKEYLRSWRQPITSSASA
jgi:hypothetical protein